jgi:hypothetical protein
MRGVLSDTQGHSQDPCESDRNTGSQLVERCKCLMLFRGKLVRFTSLHFRTAICYCPAWLRHQLLQRKELALGTARGTMEVLDHGEGL